MLKVFKGANTEGLSSVMTLATGASVSEEFRIESWQGREYTVVPVVACVEGVLHGANSSGPEFAAAAEFGKFPKSWDGRPVVMNHPQLSGVFVSAGIPSVLEEYGMGYIFNSKVEDRKLKVEAWLDHERIEELGGELLTTLERIRNNEVVDVSIGAWMTVANKSGTHGGKAYGGIWQSVAPDHLAFLSEGVPGACSVADGCGVPRLFSVNHAAIGAATTCCTGCDEGKPCVAEAPAVNEEPKVNGAVDRVAQAKLERAAYGVLVEALEAATWEGFGELSVNSLPEGMTFSDAKTIARQGLLELLNVSAYDVDLMAITTNMVVYYQWGKLGLHARNYSIDDKGALTFSGDEVPVNLLTRIQPRQATEPSVQSQENTMPGNATGEGTQTTESTETTTAGTGANPGQNSGANGAAAVVVETASVPATPATFAELLAAASPEVRESIEGGARMFAARKVALVTELVACERCKFSEEQLNGFSLGDLENMAEMANVQTFAGRAVPQDQEGISTSSAGQGTLTSVAPSNYLAAAKA